MNHQYTLRGLLSILLAAALAFSFPGLPVYAEETEPAATVETIPSGTEETEETTPAVTEETVPPTVQTQPVEPVITPISQCGESAPGIEMTIEGTVVYADGNITVLQDASGGIGLILPQDVTVEPEMVLRISGCRSAAGFVAMAWEVRGRLPLPEAEGTLGSLPECRRVVLRDATLSRSYRTTGTNFSSTKFGLAALIRLIVSSIVYTLVSSGVCEQPVIVTGNTPKDKTTAQVLKNRFVRISTTSV